MLPPMPSVRLIHHLLLAACLMLTTNAQYLTNKDVLVIFNKDDPESARLAEAYRNARDIPVPQMLGLGMPKKTDITRAEYENSILSPLREHFDSKGWWDRKRDANDILVPTRNKIRAIVLMRGVPLRIMPSPAAKPKQGEAAAPKDPISDHDEACVDSELAMFGVETLPTKGILKNAFFESQNPISRAAIPYFVLTSRIDAPAYVTCKRMITDAVETEKHGLWGRAYIDIANKIPQGDQWLTTIVAQNTKAGIPTITDRFNDTLPRNYPMTDAAIYYGWYDWNVSGPFLNTGFLFRPGAVAVHLHSFSAEQLTDPHKNWCAPLLVRGATATVGNVYEPYLSLTHHFNILHDRLLKGWTFAEAAWAAMPVASWQGVVLGDPLYRPFLHIDGTGDKRDEDRDFRALRAASRQWPDKKEERREKLADAADSLKSGNLSEGIALDYIESGDIPNAQLWLRKAKGFYVTKEDKLRQDMQIIAIERSLKNTQAAIRQLRAAKAEYGSIPEADALSGWLDIVDPPPPPVADPTKIPRQ
jgi:uncharacterized protein (TIGR03790 family)